jgi:hypothetical protein
MYLDHLHHALAQHSPLIHQRLLVAEAQDGQSLEVLLAVLIGALQDNDAQIRQQAVTFLGRKALVRAIEESPLLNDPIGGRRSSRCQMSCRWFRESCLRRWQLTHRSKTGMW